MKQAELVRSSVRAMGTVALVLTLAASCAGTIEDGGPGPASNGPGTPPGGRGSTGADPSGGGPSGMGGMVDAIPPPASACNPARRQPGPALLRRLTSSEYDSTVKDLLNDPSGPSRSFPLEAKGGGLFLTEAASTAVVAPLAAQAYMTAAEQIAANAVRNLGGLLGCSPMPAGAAEEACVRGFIERFARLAFRQPPTPQQVTDLVNLYKTIRTRRDVSRSVEVTLRAILQSPRFLYRWELGTPGPAGTAVQLTPYEVASRLSYMLWGSMPDATLLAAADAGSLGTSEQIVPQARRLWASPRSVPMIEQFFREWLDLDQLPATTRNLPDFASVKGSMEKETLAFVGHVLRGPGGAKFADGKLESLLTAPMSFLNQDLASKVYGVAGVTGTSLRAVDLDRAQRAGVLTQPGVLAVHGDTELDAPIYRGKMIREKFLCQTLPDPPGDVPPLPARDPNATIRTQLDQHRSVPSCNACHERLDPVGFGFEGYDQMGKWRAKIGTHDVNSEGNLVAVRDKAIEGPFRGAPELARKLASSSEVRDCVTKNLFRYVFARPAVGEDACSLAQAQASFASSGYDVRELVIALVQTDAFQYRSTTGGVR